MNEQQDLPLSHSAYQVPPVRIVLIREPGPSYTPKITQSADVYTISRNMQTLDREEFRILLLDTKHHVIGMHTVSIGSLSQTLVHPREVFKAAILANAAALIAVHNHPSGDPAPSPEDRTLTKRLHEAGSLLGITLLDHVVIGDEKFYSFADKGNLSA